MSAKGNSGVLIADVPDDSQDDVRENSHSGFELGAGAPLHVPIRDDDEEINRKLAELDLRMGQRKEEEERREEQERMKRPRRLLQTDSREISVSMTPPPQELGEDTKALEGKVGDSPKIAHPSPIAADVPLEDGLPLELNSSSTLDLLRQLQGGPVRSAASSPLPPPIVSSASSQGKAPLLGGPLYHHAFSLAAEQADPSNHPSRPGAPEPESNYSSDSELYPIQQVQPPGAGRISYSNYPPRPGAPEPSENSYSSHPQPPVATPEDGKCCSEGCPSWLRLC